jgi:hypothetical protein
MEGVMMLVGKHHGLDQDLIGLQQDEQIPRQVSAASTTAVVHFFH